VVCGHLRHPAAVVGTFNQDKVAHIKRYHLLQKKKNVKDKKKLQHKEKVAHIKRYYLPTSDEYFCLFKFWLGCNQ
jgi:hypothetical protein